MKKVNIVTIIAYHYYLIKARYSAVTPVFIEKFNNRSHSLWMGNIKAIRSCYTDAYYEVYILPAELEAHDRMQEEYLAKAPLQ